MIMRIRKYSNNSSYLGYAYSYPHKTSYRPLSPPICLKRTWKNENKESLFLYFHIPFCEKKCGYCNLFSLAHPSADMITAYLETLGRQAKQIREILGNAKFARIAIGGGTPTIFDCHALSKLFTISNRIMNANPAFLPTSLETSPLTADSDRLQLLKDRGVDRLSIGIQSFIEQELRVLNRSQDLKKSHQALNDIKRVEFKTLNIDLIYGIPGQTLKSWLQSLRTALSYAPEEIYIYPLYIRPHTPLSLKQNSDEDLRGTMYHAARDELKKAGYRQVSMRMFRVNVSIDPCGPVYCCQEDGMIGLGCGPRSYTRELHYSNRYAIGSQTTHQIISSYISSTNESFRFSDYGIRLNHDEQKRRYIIKSVLRSDGLEKERYHRLFCSNIYQDFPFLKDLIEKGLLIDIHGMLKLTDTGLSKSDMIGPGFYSMDVKRRMKTFILK